MAKELEKIGHHLVVNPTRGDLTDYLGPAAAANPFFSFSYGYVEISSSGGAATLKSRETRFENGKLVSQQCEGTLDQAAYERMVVDMQNQFIDQMNALMTPFFSFLPFRRIERLPGK